MTVSQMSNDEIKRLGNKLIRMYPPSVVSRDTTEYDRFVSLRVQDKRSVSRNSVIPTTWNPNPNLISSNASENKLKRQRRF